MPLVQTSFVGYLNCLSNSYGNSYTWIFSKLSFLFIFASFYIIDGKISNWLYIFLTSALFSPLFYFGSSSSAKSLIFNISLIESPLLRSLNTSFWLGSVSNSASFASWIYSCYWSWNANPPLLLIYWLSLSNNWDCERLFKASDIELTILFGLLLLNNFLSPTTLSLNSSISYFVKSWILWS